MMIIAPKYGRGSFRGHWSGPCDGEHDGDGIAFLFAAVDWLEPNGSSSHERDPPVADDPDDPAFCDILTVRRRRQPAEAALRQLKGCHEEQ